MFHVITTLDAGGELTSIGKSLTLGSGALLVVQLLEVGKYRTLKLATLSQYFTGLFLLASGIHHFLYAVFVKLLIHEWIPAGIFQTYLPGVVFAVAGLALLNGIKKSLAATIAVWMILVWGFLLRLPRAIEQTNQNEWKAVFRH